MLLVDIKTKTLTGTSSIAKRLMHIAPFVLRPSQVCLQQQWQWMECKRWRDCVVSHAARPPLVVATDL